MNSNRLVLPYFTARRIALIGRRAAVAARAAARRDRARFGKLLVAVAWLTAHAVGVVRSSADSDRLSLPGSFVHDWEAFTRIDLHPDSVTAGMIVVGSLLALRTVVLESRAYLGGASVQVMPLVNATGQQHNLAGLDAMFRSFLALPRQHQLASLPGDTEQERLIEVLTAGDADKPRRWQEIARRAYAYAVPRRAFVVEAVLRRRPARGRYEVAVHIRRLPGPFVELDTVWSSSMRRALQRAALQIGAYVLPQTKACRAEPWTDWQGKTLPPALFRRYQRAKRMVLERRYDEALHLYQQALQLDPDNVVMRYELGQLFERLRLQSDALATYLGLLDEVFPRRRATRDGAPLRRPFPTWWPARTSGPFLIRYRSVVALTAGALIAEELHRPEWDLLRTSMGPDDGGLPPSRRPFRRVEVADLRQRIGTALDPFETYVQQAWDDDAGIPAPAGKLSSLFEGSMDDDVVARQIEMYLLLCARFEAEELTRAFARVIGGRRQHASALTLTTCRQLQLLVDHRISLAQQRAPGGPRSAAESVPSIASALRDRGYRVTSKHWLEHYAAACAYALPLLDDTEPIAEHATYAREAANALARAERYGEDIAFLTAKQFWVVAGDPDLNGLRLYPAFRAFEARAYSHPLPAARSLARYERYLYSMQLLGAAAKVVEERWLRAADQLPTRDDLEQLWREEYQAWQLMIRMGLFYRQWQTRRSLHATVRTWFERSGPEMDPVPYPNVLSQRYSSFIDDFDRVDEELAAVEGLLDRLGGLDDLADRPQPPDALEPTGILQVTRAWIMAAQSASRLVEVGQEQHDELMAAIRHRVELWCALRQWTEDPLVGDTVFAAALDQEHPPSSWPRARRTPIARAIRRSRRSGDATG